MKNNTIHMPRLTQTEKKNLLAYGKQYKSLRSICNDKSLLIPPTIDARLAFVRDFVPKWMRQFGRNIWEVGQRLAEEIEENFQFVPDWQPLGKKHLHNGELRERMSLAHIIVLQQLNIKMLEQCVKNLEKSVK
jgi:hypothetical protein